MPAAVHRRHEPLPRPPTDGTGPPLRHARAGLRNDPFGPRVGYPVAPATTRLGGFGHDPGTHPHRRHRDHPRPPRERRPGLLRAVPGPAVPAVDHGADPLHDGRRRDLRGRDRPRGLGQRHRVGVRGRERRPVRRHHLAAQRGRGPRRDRLRLASRRARHRGHGAGAPAAARLGLRGEGPAHGRLVGQQGQLGLPQAGLAAGLRLRGDGPAVAAAARRAARRLGRHAAPRRRARTAATVAGEPRRRG